MAEAKSYLDKEGLTTLVSKIKEYIGDKTGFTANFEGNSLILTPSSGSGTIFTAKFEDGSLIFTPN